MMWMRERPWLRLDPKQLSAWHPIWPITFHTTAMELSNEAAEVFMCLEIDSLAVCKVFTGGCVGKLYHKSTKCTHFVSITKDIKILILYIVKRLRI